MPAIRVLHDDALEALRGMDDASIDAVVCDPPYGLSKTDPAHVAETLAKWVTGDHEYTPPVRSGGLMGKTWDSFVPPPAVWDECMRVLKPGGHLLAFAGSRTQDLMGLSIRLAGFDMRETLMWLYGSGMPKSIDLERSLAARGEDQVAAEFAGWASGLKPAYEPVIAARKPFPGSLTANVATHGVGGYNIDATRVATADGEVNPSISRRKGAVSHLKHGTPAAETEAQGRMASRTSPERYAEQRAGEEKGRWPTNVLLDPEAAAAMDTQSGTSTSRKGKPRKSAKPGDGYGMTHTGAEYNDSGGASRFFPVFKYQTKASAKERPQYAAENGQEVKHPTVKPLELMRWLVRLVTPPGGTVLDPFAGSGTTGEAAWVEGFDSILVEAQSEYLPLIAQRIGRVSATAEDAS